MLKIVRCLGVWLFCRLDVLGGDAGRAPRDTCEASTQKCDTSVEPPSVVGLLPPRQREEVIDYPLLSFGEPATIDLPSGERLGVASGSRTWQVGNFSKSVNLFKVEGMMTKDSAEDMLREIPATLSKAPDSVDNLPVYEYYLDHHLLFNSATVPKRLLRISNSIIEERILPYVRKQYNCSVCRVCTSLVRRYQTDERMRHPPHFDTHAFITVVVALTTHGTHFRGGLYVRTTPGTEEFVHVAAGDALVHQSDIQHGVWVKKGNRLSWILWIQDSPQCKGPLASWHKAAAIGDPLAAYQLSLMYKFGAGDVSQDRRVALELLQKAAWGGLPNAQRRLGDVFFEDRPLISNMKAAFEWYSRAAKQNDTAGAYQAARMLQHGLGTTKDDASAARLYEQAAGDSFEQMPDAANELARMLFKGRKGVPKDKQEALRLWEEAASLGVQAAAASLEDCYARGDGVEANAAKAQEWKDLADKL